MGPSLHAWHVHDMCCAGWDRDIAEAQAGHSVMSVVCCGHSPKSKIVHMAFQPDGTFLVWSMTPLLQFLCMNYAVSGAIACMRSSAHMRKNYCKYCNLNMQRGRTWPA